MALLLSVRKRAACNCEWELHLLQSCSNSNNNNKTCWPTSPQIVLISERLIGPTSLFVWHSEKYSVIHYWYALLNKIVFKPNSESCDDTIQYTGRGFGKYKAESTRVAVTWCFTPRRKWERGLFPAVGGEQAKLYSDLLQAVYGDL